MKIMKDFIYNFYYVGYECDFRRKVFPPEGFSKKWHVIILLAKGCVTLTMKRLAKKRELLTGAFMRESR